MTPAWIEEIRGRLSDIYTENLPIDDKTMKDIERLLKLVDLQTEALKEIYQDGVIRVPCPDDKPGCLVLHYHPNSQARRAEKALEAGRKIGEKD